jgi:hypothetical protein
MPSNRELAAKHIALADARHFRESDSARAEEVVDTNVRIGRMFHAVGLLGQLGAGAQLELAMLDWIIEDDPQGTPEHLVRAASFIPRLGEPALRGGGGELEQPLIELALQRFAPLEGLDRLGARMMMRDGPLCLISAAVLTNTVDRTLPLLRRFGPMISEHYEEDYHSLDALGLLAALTGDAVLRAAFDYRLPRFLASEGLQEFFKANYAQIVALLARDQAALDAATELAANQFMQRRKDKKSVAQRLGLGPYSYTQFDLLGVTIGKLALLTGMRFDHDSRAMPRGVVTMFY